MDAFGAFLVLPPSPPDDGTLHDLLNERVRVRANCLPAIAVATAIGANATVVCPSGCHVEAVLPGVVSLVRLGKARKCKAWLVESCVIMN